MEKIRLDQIDDLHQSNAQHALSKEECSSNVERVIARLFQSPGPSSRVMPVEGMRNSLRCRSTGCIDSPSIANH